jgi:hypothetical protein
LLGAIARRRHDRAPRRRQLLDERPAGARGVHEDDLLRRQLLQLRVEVGRAHIGAGEVELGVAAVKAAVADQRDEDEVVRTGGLREGVEGLGNLLARRLAGDVLVPLRGSVDQVDETFRRDAKSLRRIGERRTPLVKRLAMFRVTGEADDDEEEDLQHQASPTARR